MDEKKLSKRRLAQVVHHIDWACQVLGLLYEMYEPYHPELAEDLIDLGRMGMMWRDCVLGFWRECWGHVPKNLEGYRGATKEN